MHIELYCSSDFFCKQSKIMHLWRTMIDVNKLLNMISIQNSMKMHIKTMNYTDKVEYLNLNCSCYYVMSLIIETISLYTMVLTIPSYTLVKTKLF